jgi:hypothetical protein
MVICNVCQMIHQIYTNLYKLTLWIPWFRDRDMHTIGRPAGSSSHADAVVLCMT